MSERLQALLGPAPRDLDGVLAEEELLYGRFLAALEAAIDAAEHFARAGAPAARVA